jgi:hypothetical protein
MKSFGRMNALRDMGSLAGSVNWAAKRSPISIGIVLVKFVRGRDRLNAQRNDIPCSPKALYEYWGLGEAA